MKDVLDLNLQLFLRNLLPEHTDLELEMIAYAEENHVSIVEPAFQGYFKVFFLKSQCFNYDNFIAHIS